MLAPLQLLDYAIDEFSYRQLLEREGEEEEGVALGFDIEAREASEEITALRLVVRFNEEEERETEEGANSSVALHRGHIAIVGQFAWAVDTGDLDEGKQDRLMLNNGLSMLYGIARTYLAQVSEPGPASRLFLPSFSFRQHVEQWLEDGEAEDE